MTDSPTAPPHSTMRRDIASAYAAAAVKVLSWALVSRFAYLDGDAAQFALLALIRSTIGLLNYTTLGLGPAMIQMLAQAGAVRSVSHMVGNDVSDPLPGGTLGYARPMPAARARVSDPLTTVYANGLALCAVLALIAFYGVRLYADHFDHFYRLPEHPEYWKITLAVGSMGFGLACRLFSDASGALLQVRGKIWFDNLLVASADVLWVILSWPGQYHLSSMTLAQIGMMYGITGLLLMLARVVSALMLNGLFVWHRAPLRMQIIGPLLAYGCVVTIGQLADFLYAPVDFILINRLIDPAAGAIYAPAVQIDSGLLLLVAGLAAVLLPKAAIAHAGGETQRLRNYYVRGTLASIGMLTAGAAMVWLISPILFTIWLRESMLATRAILPLVLIHTVVGGSSAVGRSILLGMGKVKPFTISVLVAGVSNVILSYIFVRYLGLGLTGIILGTIVAVVGRCAIWMPWYVLKCLRQTENFSPETIPT